MKIVLEENQLNDDMTEEIEYLIDNNLFFENIQVHTCPILKEHIIEYKIKNKYILIELVENTFNRYFNDLKEGKRLYELEEEINPLYSKKRYKNNISKNVIEKLKTKYINSNLHYLEQVVSSVAFPYLDYLIRFLHCINGSLYIKENQFNKTFEYTTKNYENKTESIKKDAENNFDENKFNDVKLHKGLIELYNENKIEGSLVIASLTNKIANKLINEEYFDKKDIDTIKRNENFNKLFEKTNFTKNEMINGFAQACYWNYAQFNFKNYKIHRKNYNISRTSTIPYIRKDMISKDLIELFNIAFEKEEIIQIRQNKSIPTVLKIYDEIHIYVVKDITKIEEDFHNFIIENFFSQTEKIKKFVKENEKQLFQLTKQLRHIFY